ncbi:glutamate carboxypeptidase [Cupriavidus respiraculi]|uniref:Carboxypeptidase G2 n=1 Tax=Cupriavidus respiraculi TaxID=195930 RepID=A0ABN7Z202_9BURK|nr:glutamate carboxypeptidase [Cupriavidus respiraculi]CAG9179433.1 Carboxypeptidase G2 [Cupriavidus respiraculi]
MQPRLLRLAAVAVPLFMPFCLAGAARAAAPDAALLEAARAAEPAVIVSLKDMVAIESGSANEAGLAAMADYTERRLAALGARTERVAPAAGRSPIVKATLSGSGTRRVMLIAHMDTVYPAGTLATQPIRLDGNRLYGPGIADDKGGIAVILHALEILKARGWRDYAQLTVLFNADEEVGSTGSGDIISRLADEHDVVLSCEPTAAKAVVKTEALLLGASGTATATMEVKGRSAHAGAAPDRGRNALLELAYQLQQTRDVAKSVPGTQLNWTTAKAGEARNQIPDRASAIGDVRVTVADGAAALKTALQNKVAEGRLVPDTETTIAMEEGRPAFLANERGRALAKRAQQIYAELDGRPLALAEGTGGGTDAGFAGRSGKAAVVESFGLAGFGYHARDEYIEIDSIVPRLYLMTRMLQEIGREGVGAPQR